MGRAKCIGLLVTTILVGATIVYSWTSTGLGAPGLAQSTLQAAVIGIADEDVKDMRRVMTEVAVELKELRISSASVQEQKSVLQGLQEQASSEMLKLGEIQHLQQEAQGELLLLKEAITFLQKHSITKDEMSTYIKGEWHVSKNLTEKREVRKPRGSKTKKLPELDISKATQSLNEVWSLETKACKLPAPARIDRVTHITEPPTACLWEPVPDRTDLECLYRVTGTCKLVHHKGSGCSFYGFHQNEQYQPSALVLPDPVDGEISLTSDEEAMLRKPFEDCSTRPKYFRAVEPLLHNGKVVASMGTDDEPMILMAGGSASIVQHFYFVLNEVGTADSYRLGWQNSSAMEVVVDIGANIGLFSISVCKRFPNARILAFEPHPANFRFLVANIKAAGCEDRVEAFNKGISNDGRSMKIYWHESIGTSAFRVGAHYIRMETITPASLFQLVGKDTVSLLKIDCEGCEYEVVPLLPMARVQQMFCEVHHATVLMETDDTKGTKDQVHEVCKRSNPWGICVFG